MFTLCPAVSMDECHRMTCANIVSSPMNWVSSAVPAVKSEVNTSASIHFWITFFKFTPDRLFVAFRVRCDMECLFQVMKFPV
jgi:hypothetical protein